MTIVYNVPTESGSTPETFPVTIRQSGEVDSVESVKVMLDGIGLAIPKPTEKSWLRDNKSTLQSIINWATSTMMNWLTGLKNGTNKAPKAVHADESDEAGKLDHTVQIAGVNFDGSSSISLSPHDVGAAKVYWGTSSPSSQSFQDLRDGDLYIKVQQ